MNVPDEEKLLKQVEAGWRCSSRHGNKPARASTSEACKRRTSKSRADCEQDVCVDRIGNREC